MPPLSIFQFLGASAGVLPSAVPPHKSSSRRGTIPPHSLLWAEPGGDPYSLAGNQAQRPRRRYGSVEESGLISEGGGGWWVGVVGGGRRGPGTSGPARSAVSLRHTSVICGQHAPTPAISGPSGPPPPTPTPPGSGPPVGGKPLHQTSLQIRSSFFYFNNIEVKSITKRSYFCLAGGKMAVIEMVMPPLPPLPPPI